MNHHPNYSAAKELMSTMIRTSQQPGQGNTEFVEAMQELLKPYPFVTHRHPDTAYNNRELLSVDVGDPAGEQILVATSHSDVVSVDGQHWSTKPWMLTESDDMWFGRGACDTHGTGTAMLLAGLREDVRQTLIDARKRITILFTYDEEATTSIFSMRGARLAAGLLGNAPLINAKYYIAGEPTEIDGVITPMRGHKGRLLAHFRVETDSSGHVSQPVENALMSGSQIIMELAHYGRMMTYGHNENNEHCAIYSPPFSTLQVSAARVKAGDFSTTPSEAEFTLDMRTIPQYHDIRADEVTSLMERQALPRGTTVKVHVEKNAAGSSTRADSPMVRLSEAVAQKAARGFNGGDEGRIFRNSAGMEGVTIGPGDLKFAHMPDERIRIDSLFRGADVYAELFKRSVCDLSPASL